jgi:hypothetical protein
LILDKQDTATKVKYSDSKLILIIRWFSWITASIISALINVWFVSQLASHFYEMIIFAIVALVLECGKLSAILRANIFSALFKKVGGKNINTKRKSSYIVYIIYAIFAIICATGFSVNMTTTTTSNYDTQIALLESQKINIQNLQIITPIPEELLKVKESYEELQQLYLTTNREDDTVQYAYRTKQVKENGEVTSWADSNASTQKLRSVTRDRDAALTQVTTLQLQYDEIENRRKEQLAESEQKFGSLVDIDTQIGTLKINKAMNAGSAQIFITLGNLFGFDPNTFRLILLIFLSILIEYIIFSLAPTSKVNRKLLYDYREFIEKEKVAEILEEFDKELDLYLGDRSPESTLDQQIRLASITPRKRRVRKQKLEDVISKVPVSNITVQAGLQSIPIEKVKEVPMEPASINKEFETIQQVEILSKQKLEEAKSIENEKKVEEIVDKSIELSISNEELNSIKKAEQIAFSREETNQNVEIKQPISEKQIHYKFGRTTEVIMEKLIEFIRICIKDRGSFEVHPDTAALTMKLGTRAKQVFIDRLLAIRLGTKPLIERNKYGEYFSNYSAQQIIDYVSEVKDD